MYKRVILAKHSPLSMIDINPQLNHLSTIVANIIASRRLSQEPLSPTLPLGEYGDYGNNHFYPVITNRITFYNFDLIVAIVSIELLVTYSNYILVKEIF